MSGRAERHGGSLLEAGDAFRGRVARHLWEAPSMGAKGVVQNMQYHKEYQIGVSLKYHANISKSSGKSVYHMFIIYLMNTDITWRI